jgi:hypothetical protein
MGLTADIWADARLQGMSAAGAATLDADALIAAQTREMIATVVTKNPKRLAGWVPVRVWP